MGNQMPARCMVPCNPVCCAMCFHQDAGRENDNEHKTGSIFANAASVLSMAAEEISLDDHLEKELANEVELWRMETTSTAVQVHEDGAYRTVFAPIGRDSLGGNSIDSSSALSSPDHGGIDSDMEDMPESTRESSRDRGRGSTDFAYTGGRRVAPGTREGTGMSTESSGLSAARHGFSTPASLGVSSREETATSSLINGGAATGVSIEDVLSGQEDIRPAKEAATVAEQSFESSKVTDRVALGSRAVASGPAPSSGGPGRAVGCDGSISAGGGGGANWIPSGSPRVGGSPRAGGPPQTGSSPRPESSPRAGTTAVAPNTQTYLAESAGQGQREASLPNPGESDGARAQEEEVPNTDEVVLDDMSSSSSSEEDSFVGFLEDPLEKEMQAPSTAGRPHNYRALGLSPDREIVPVSIPARANTFPQRAELLVEQAATRPTAKASLTGLEGVRSDRSDF